MSSSHSLRREPDARGGQRQDRTRRELVLAADGDESEGTALLGLLEDDFVQRILEALSAGPRPARELVDVVDASRSTVYRRLNRLESYDLVTVDLQVHEDGHHRKVFESTFERATFELEDGTPQVRLVVTDSAPQNPSHPRLSAD